MVFRLSLIPVFLLCLTGCGDVSPKVEEVEAAPVAAEVATAENAAKPADAVSIDIAGLDSRSYWAPAKVEDVEEGRRLLTGAGSGAFSAMLDLTEESRVPGLGIVRINLQVVKGTIVLSMVVPGDAATQKSSQVVAQEWADDQTVDIEVAQLGDPLSVLFANGATNGASEVIVKSVQVVPGAKATP
jgi:hypothetical protein